MTAWYSGNDCMGLQEPGTWYAVLPLEWVYMFDPCCKMGQLDMRIVDEDTSKNQLHSGMNTAEETTVKQVSQSKVCLLFAGWCQHNGRFQQCAALPAVWGLSVQWLLISALQAHWCTWRGGRCVAGYAGYRGPNVSWGRGDAVSQLHV